MYDYDIDAMGILLALCLWQWCVFLWLTSV